jgi:hypothetical protein
MPWRGSLMALHVSCPFRLDDNNITIISQFEQSTLLTQASALPLNHVATSSLTMASSALNYSLLSIPAYYVFSIVPHMYAGAILSSEGYKVNNANPKASLSPDNVKGKVSNVCL